MKHYQIMPRNWFLIDGKPRPVTGLRNHVVFAPYSTEHPNSIHFDSSKVEPLTISRELIAHSNLRSTNQEDENIYDSLWQNHETLLLPFLIKFDFESDTPCEIILPKGDNIQLKYIHRLQQFIQAVTGESMSIRMPF